MVCCSGRANSPNESSLWGLFPASNWMPLDFVQGESDEKDVVLMCVSYKPAVPATCESGMGLPNIVGRGLGGGRGRSSGT